MDDLTRIPIEYLNRIADHCPRAMSTYLLCWREADDDLDVMLSKRFILFDYYNSFTRVLNDIKALAREGLLSFTVQDDAIFATLANYGNG